MVGVYVYMLISMKVRKEIEKLFEEKKRKLGVEAELELSFLENTPVVGYNVYGEAFPPEKKVVLEVFAPDATTEEIEEIICHELVHLKYPELDEDSKELEENVLNCLDSARKVLRYTK